MAKAFDKTQVKQIRKLLADRKSGLRDLALFNTGISTMLRTSDLLNLKVSDVMDEFGDLKKKFSVRMQKTDRPVTVLLDQESERSLRDWIEESGKNRSDFIFTGLTTRTIKTPITSAHHRLLVKEWCKAIGIGTEGKSTHSLRKTRASIAYKQTGNLEVVRQALGHTNLRNTATYLDVDNEEFLEMPYSLWEKIADISFWNKWDMDRLYSNALKHLVHSWAWGSGNMGAEIRFANFFRDKFTNESLIEMGINNPNDISKDEIITLINTFEPQQIFEELVQRRETDFMSMPTFNIYGNGWLNRLSRFNEMHIVNG